METRGFVVGIGAVVLIVACSALAGGWMRVADDALAERDRCIATRSKAVFDIVRITITETDIRYRGVPLAATEAVRGAGFTFDPLFDRLHAERVAKCASNRVCLDNLVLVDNAGGNDEVLARIVRTGWAAGYDVVLQAPRTW